ncbi:MAG: hypothetical protein HIU86_11420 [Acidobacteria bacterium]|nr:hypothetical protein [Acidobacteriota bacterium]
MIPPLLAAAADPVGSGIFLGWAPITISIGNFIVIVAMVVLFVAALFVPFLHDRDE